MRISSTMMVGSYLTQLNKSWENQSKLMEQSDGKSLHRASDNSVNYAKYIRYQNGLSENDQYQSNVKTGVSWMKNSDAALVNITNSFSTIKEKVTGAANSTNNTSDMSDIAKEMLAQIQGTLASANSQVGDRYLFSGQADLTQPFTLSNEKLDRGLSKTLDDSQKAFFSGTDSNRSGSLSQMLALQDDSGNVAYYLNTANGKVYTKAFVENGYKDKIAAGQTAVKDEDAAATLSNDSLKDGKVPISENFKGTGEIISDTTVTPGSTARGSQWRDTLTIDGKDVTVRFATVKQYIATYNGDAKYISMVKQNGSVQPSTDTVNATGQDIFGSDIFDDANSGQTVSSGTAMLNNILLIQAKTEAGDSSWMSSDGMTIADAAHSNVLTAETKMAARQQAYTDTTTMLTTQNESITSDVTDVSSTDVSKLAVQLMEAQTIYNMSLSVGSKILPPSLADYLS